MLYFLSQEFASFLYNIEKGGGGGGVGSQSKPDLKWNKWNVAISTWFSQLSQLLLSPIVELSKKN